MKSTHRAASLLCVSLLHLGTAEAATLATCVVSDSNLNFNSYNPVSATPNVVNASIVVTCGELIGGGGTDTVAFTMLLSAGSSGSVTNRKMTGGTPNLPYNIYTTGSYSTVWDNTTGLAGSVTIVGLLGLPILIFGSSTMTGFGRILPAQAVAPGSYMDSLTITINY